MRYYIYRAMLCSSKPKNNADRTISQFMAKGIIEVNEGEYHCKATNLEGEVLSWWSANKYYAYGNELRMFAKSGKATRVGGSSSLYYKNLLANIERGNLTKERESVTLYKCKENRYHDMYIYNNRLYCSDCNRFYETHELIKDKGVFG